MCLVDGWLALPSWSGNGDPRPNMATGGLTCIKVLYDHRVKLSYAGHSLSEALEKLMKAEKFS